ncbi:hypothetical protein [Spiroplasma cantharicola]|uniref:Uncharacterized protein n=1 Tax=Spiroplasma cantharicola TaxID=362837 RepID=A0A0M5KH44_9MOLU|nr:hypothetical protein [Spiroplasma cantharicola]ALD66851.1 hypothetical protein SCANT_v1c09450 [Spiroplasma cantharicola]
MKKIKNNLNLIVIFILLFLTFPIQNILNQKTNIIILSLFVNITLIIISLYFITVFISNLLRYIEKYNDEVSKKNLISMSLLNNNYKFYITMLVTFLFFIFSITQTYISIERTTIISMEVYWWTNYKFHKIINLDYINILFFTQFLLISSLLLYSFFYIVFFSFIYSVIKIVSKSNEDLNNLIYKKSTKLNLFLKMFIKYLIFIKLSSKKIKNSWKEIIILISNIKSEELKTFKKATTPPLYL